MLKRYGSLILMAFLLASCAHHGVKRTPVAVQPTIYKSTTQYKPVPGFSQVEAQGQINVTLHTGYRKPQVVLRGDPRDLEQVKVFVSLNTLHVVLGKGFPHHGAVHADIQGPYLARFSFKGEGTITGSQLRTGSLDLFIANTGTTRLGGSIGLHQLVVSGNGFTEVSGVNSSDVKITFLQGSPKVQLSGVANITTLNMKSDAWFSMYWLKSDSLTIRAKDRARIQLAGTANRLDVELWGRAHFKGRYLRAQRSFVRTHGHSIAEISSVNHQSTLATDASDIFYYNLPNTREDFMAYDGSVLDMREWDRVDLRDFDRYNKQFP